MEKLKHYHYVGYYSDWEITLVAYNIEQAKELVAKYLEEWGDCINEEDSWEDTDISEPTIITPKF